MTVDNIKEMTLREVERRADAYEMLVLALKMMVAERDPMPMSMKRDNARGLLRELGEGA